MTKALVGFVVAFGLASSGLAQSDFRALIRIDLRATALLPGSSTPDHWEAHHFYAQGGLLVTTFVQRSTHGVHNFILRGKPGSDVLAALKRTLKENRIGQQRNCWTNRDPRLTGKEEVIWNGRGSREHRFVVTFSREAVAGLPECSAETEGILEILDDYYSIALHFGELIVHSD